jgi:hypothetical protein
MIVIMQSLSEKYGWTPNEIRKLSVHDMLDYIEIANIKSQLQKAQQKKHGRK